MVTKEFTYKKAFQNKKAAVRQMEQERHKRLTALYAENPELYDIDAELKALGTTLLKVTLSGDREKTEALKVQSQALTAQKEKLFASAGIKKQELLCEKCRDTGYVSGKICDCIRAEAAKIMAEELSREMPLTNCRFDNFDLSFYPNQEDSEGQNPKRRMTAILKLCRDYAESFTTASQNLLFTGNAGLGKTHLTLAIVAEVIKKGFMPVYGSAENLFCTVETEKFSGEGRGNYETMLHCDLLVIDDLGAEMATAFTKSVLYNLINTRLLSGKPTIINTNLSMKEIEVKYSARISSRLIGHYNANRFLGSDIRQQKLLGKN